MAKPEGVEHGAERLHAEHHPRKQAEHAAQGRDDADGARNGSAAPSDRAAS